MRTYLTPQPEQREEEHSERDQGHPRQRKRDCPRSHPDHSFATVLRSYLSAVANELARIKVDSLNTTAHNSQLKATHLEVEEELHMKEALIAK